MGPKRRTRNVKGGSKSIVPLTTDQQLMRDHCDLLIKDFDKEVESIVAQSLREVGTVSDSISMLYKLELMKLSQEEKSMKWDDYWQQNVEQGDDKALTINKAVEAAVESVVSSVDKQLSTIKSSAVRKGRKRKVDNQDTATKPSTRQKRGSSANKSGITDVSCVEPPLTSSKSVATPANTRPHPGKGGKTPFITPKFDTSSLTRTVTRVAKVDEVLVSLSGSPVSAVISDRSKAAKLIKEKNATIPLGNGETLNVPVDGEMENTVGLDDQQAAKLKELHRNLGNMLRMRDQALKEDE